MVNFMGVLVQEAGSGAGLLIHIQAWTNPPFVFNNPISK
jgi:hypothetical protein